jgi:hypothetical protein
MVGEVLCHTRRSLSRRANAPGLVGIRERPSSRVRREYIDCGVLSMLKTPGGRSGGLSGHGCVTDIEGLSFNDPFMSRENARA